MFLQCETSDDIRRTKFDCPPKAAIIVLEGKYYAELYDDYRRQRGNKGEGDSNDWIDSEDNPKSRGCFPCALTREFNTERELREFLINGGVRKKYIYPATDEKSILIYRLYCEFIEGSFLPNISNKRRFCEKYGINYDKITKKSDFMNAIFDVIPTLSLEQIQQLFHDNFEPSTLGSLSNAIRNFK